MSGYDDDWKNYDVDWHAGAYAHVFYTYNLPKTITQKTGAKLKWPNTWVILQFALALIQKNWFSGYIFGIFY